MTECLECQDWAKHAADQAKLREREILDREAAEGRLKEAYDKLAELLNLETWTAATHREAASWLLARAPHTKVVLS